MRIVIDMQGTQTESRFRGIGRYTMSFVQAVVRNRGEHDVVLVLNGMFPDTIEPIRTEFDGILPSENIRVWYAEAPVAEINQDNDERRNVAELLREAFIAKLKPDILHICSLFEGYIDDAVNSIGKFDDNCAVSVALYDLIPLLNEEHYLKPNPRYASYYLNKIDSLKKAKLCLAISEFSRQEGLSHLPFSDDQIINVSTAIEPYFKPVPINSGVREKLLEKFNICHPFVLYTGGADERKNLLRLIEAYSKLSHKIRAVHQLLFAGKMSDGQIELLQSHARKAGLGKDELCFSGYISDEELLQLYNLCKVFVFPSWHEGFGLPALEAMACGAAVITANSSSLPEVVGLADAQFDPLDIIAISEKLSKALTNDDFCNSLKENGLQRAKLFSWNITANRAISAWEKIATASGKTNYLKPKRTNKPKLAFISPLPPERTGIADYSAELLPALAEYYDIDAIVTQTEVSNSWINKNCRIRDIKWFIENSGSFDRVLYQVGNSPFHHHMLQMMRDIPGTVVLHDFYLSGLVSWQQLHAGMNHAWDNQLYLCHGYKALKSRYEDIESCKKHYPVNFPIFQYAAGVIVHSLYSKNLAHQWYANVSNLNWQVIPLLRALPQARNTSTIRNKLGFKKDDFIICSFGFIDYSKLNHRLLDCWLASDLAENSNCHLVFVGENHGGDYGECLLTSIENSPFSHRIKITGFASPDLFKDYLAIADLAVQLRTQSRGETSAAVLDCMTHGKPLIVNANGSMAELDPDAVIMLDDNFTDSDLISAIHNVCYNENFRSELGKKAKNVASENNSPARCAEMYFNAIENNVRKLSVGRDALISKLASNCHENDDQKLIKLARLISLNQPVLQPQTRILLDVTATCQNDLKTGIERVARAVLLNLLDVVPTRYRVEPVYLTEAPDGWTYRYARNYMCDLLDCDLTVFKDDIVDPINGDILITLDNSGHKIALAAAQGLFKFYRNHGVKVLSVVYDLLPVTMPEVFPPGANIGHSEWLHTITKFDGAICISKAVANELQKWVNAEYSHVGRSSKYEINWFHLGADVTNSSPSMGIPENAQWLLDKFTEKPTFLMVGTIEPRKGYLQTISAFTELWSEGIDVNLVIVGREGWTPLPDDMRRDLPETIASIINHKELNKRLFWLNGISDEFLDQVYACSSCLLASSYGEGFGLPLIEAAQHKVPIIARDIPVFREVAGSYARYFENELGTEKLCASIIDWLKSYNENRLNCENMMPWLTWHQSAEQLLEILLNKNLDKVI